MATVHLGRLEGSAGFARTVAVKRLHPHLCEDPNFTGAFADEARLAARIRHPNVVPTLDVVSTEGELLIVMEYVDGDSLSALIRRTLLSGQKRIPLPIIIAIVSEMLHGLHSAHEAKSETGKPLDIVHRDVSPQNVLVGADGVARLVDFGIARATGKNRQAQTGENDLKGKLAYMAPEQIRRENVSRRTDVFAAGVVLWELLTGERLFASDNEAATMEKILVGWVQPPRQLVPEVPVSLNDIALRALDADPNNRFETAREMAVALEDAMPRSLGREVGAWVEKTAVEVLTQRRALVAKSEKLGLPANMRSSAISVTGETLSSNELQSVSSVSAATPVDAPTTPRREPFTVPPNSTPRSRGPMTITGPIPPDILDLREPTERNPRTFTGPLPLEEVTPVAVAAPELGVEYERTVTSFGESHPPMPPLPIRSRTDRIAYALFGGAVLVTLIVALSWSKIGGKPAVNAMDFPPPPEPPTATAPTATAVLPADPPMQQPQAVAAERPQPMQTIVAPPVVRPVIRPKIRPAVSSPGKQPCIARLDPTTNKKIYQGDCD
jgi:serine/threonine-protein kinase